MAPRAQPKSVDMAESLEAAKSRWQALSGDALAEEVACYRAAVAAAVAAARASGADCASDAEFEVAADEGDEEGDVRDGGGEGADGGNSAQQGGADGELLEGDVDELDPSEWQVPTQSIPVHANVTRFNWEPLAAACKFDVIMMDPPWQLATANPTRGVSLGYSQLGDDFISALPVNKLQDNGLLFVWVINAKYQWTLNQFKKWGYQFVDEIVWVKVTNSRRLAKSHGFYLQHAKEVCLVAKKGKTPANLAAGAGSDVIFAPRRGQSQKPTEIYELIERLVPNGKYLEIFARKNNLRDYWVSIGNEVTGTGLPPEDNEAVAAGGAIPNASYGRGNQ